MKSRTLKTPSRTRGAPSRTREAPSRTLEAPSRTREAPSRTLEAPSNSDEETNFRLLTGEGGGDPGKSSHTGEEEASDEEDEGTGPAEEEDGDSGASGDGGAGSPEITTREDMKKELSSMSFEDILKLQSRVGTRVFNEVAYGSEQPEGSQKKKKRLNKNRPAEVSTKKPAPFLRQVVPVRKAVVRDPRFDDLSGEYKPEIFEKTYKFIDDIKHREREMVQKQLRRTKNKGRKEKLQLLLRRMENQERAKKDRELQRERDLQLRQQQRERADGGAPPFFLKSSERRQLQLADKYQRLKQSGRLETFLSRRRRRNASKDRRRLPPQQQPETRTRT